MILHIKVEKGVVALISEDQIRASTLRYLTNRLLEDERAIFENQLLTDQDFSDAVAVQEQDFIDGYVLGSLNPEEVRFVHPWIEASPRLMQRVSMAKALLIRRPQRALRKQFVAVALAAAACVLVAIGVSLEMSTRSHPKEVASGTVANTSPLQDGATQPTDNTGKPAVILLVAERIRGDQQITTYQVSRDVPVQLQVLLAGETARSGYTLKVESMTEKRHILLQQQDLEAQSVEGRLYIKSTFPPGSLPPGSYRILVHRGGETLVAQFAVKQ